MGTLLCGAPLGKVGPRILYNVSRISLLAKKKGPTKIFKKCVTTPILKPTDGQKPETFFA